MPANRSTGAPGVGHSRGTPSRATAATWRVNTGRVRGANAGAMVRRCAFQSSPVASSRPRPTIGRRMRMAARVRR